MIPWISDWLSNGSIVLSWWLIGGFVLFVMTQAANYPLGMYMTDERGLKFQVLPIVIMVPINLALSFWLTTRIGAGGPIIGSSIAVVLCQVLPNIFYVRRDVAERRAQAAAAAHPRRGAFDDDPGEEIAEQDILEGPRQP